MSHWSSVSSPIKEGELKKQSKNLKFYRKRWCVLTNTKLYTFKSQQDSSKKTNATEIFDLCVYDRIEVVENNSKKLQLKFKLCSTWNNAVNTRYFQCKCNKELNDWVKTFQQINFECFTIHDDIHQIRQINQKDDIKQRNVAFASQNPVVVQLMEYGFTRHESITAFKLSMTNDDYQRHKYRKFLSDNLIGIEQVEVLVRLFACGFCGNNMNEAISVLLQENNDMDDYKLDHRDVKNAEALLSLKRTYIHQGKYNLDVDDDNLSTCYLINSECRHEAWQCPYSAPKCPSLNRIAISLTGNSLLMGTVLNGVASNIYMTDFSRELLNGIFANTKTYNMEVLLNDFNHILLAHENEYETIHNLLIIGGNGNPCNLEDCDAIKRHYRDENDTALSKLYSNCQTPQDIIRQQLIDKIHCYYFHSFDTGYKINISTLNSFVTNDDNKSDAEYQASTYDQIVHKLYCHVKGKRDDTHKYINRFNGVSNKFTTTVEDRKTNVDEPFYSFGYRYFYHEKYKNNESPYDDVKVEDGLLTRQHANEGYTVSDWYIKPKFYNLKQELLHNTICPIAPVQFNLCQLEAEKHAQGDVAKKITNKKHSIQIQFGPGPFSPIFQNKKAPNPTIGCNHLISLMIYCNYDVLQRKFSETFRRIPLNETDQSLKQRHSNFGIFGRYLRESVEWFPFGKSKQSLFHGINRKLNFNSIYTFINGPVSTTINFYVAAQFGDVGGMILEFDMSDDSYSAIHHKSFDCRWLSRYTNEQEIFFIGGCSTFSFKTIIEAPFTKNYGPYIAALSKITKEITTYGGLNSEYKLSHKQKKLIFRLLLHALHKCYPNNKLFHKFENIPKYIDVLLHNHCRSIQTIEFAKPYKCNKEIFELYRNLFFYDRGTLKLDLVTKLFPNLKKVMLWDWNHEFLQDESFYLSVLNYLKQNKITKLEMIMVFVFSPPMHPQKAKLRNKIMRKYYKQLIQYNWTFDIWDGSLVMKSLYCEEELESHLFLPSVL